VLVAALCLCSSCEEEWTTLPPETQTGANTIGCYVDGKLHVAEGLRFLGEANPYAVYTHSYDILAISSYGKGIDVYIYISIYNPGEQLDNLKFGIYYRDYKRDIIIEANEGETPGEVYLTKFDRTAKTVSGRFSMKLYYYSNGIEDSVLITQGRFDLKLQ
jgi:hypothetical protein